MYCLIFQKLNWLLHSLKKPSEGHVRSYFRLSTNIHKFNYIIIISYYYKYFAINDLLMDVAIYLFFLFDIFFFNHWIMSPTNMCSSFFVDIFSVQKLINTLWILYSILSITNIHFLIPMDFACQVKNERIWRNNFWLLNAVL